MAAISGADSERQEQPNERSVKKMKNRANNWRRRRRFGTPNRIKENCGFTLLEMLIVLALIVVLLGGVAALVHVFSNSYTADERRVGRAQLARSISQMLDEDLGSAVQDPIQAVAEDSNRQFIRHFGLRGDSRSLQIDVVQPSLFASVATASENSRVLSGGDKSSDVRQVPELKTIFYEFVPINATEEYDTASSASSLPTGSQMGEDLGSTLSGSLTSDAASDFDLLNSAFLDGTRPLAQKYGLSRRELDFETPEDEGAASASSDAATGAATIDPQTGMAESRLAGSLTAPPDAQDSQLASTDPQTNELLGIPDETQRYYKEPMTAVQIAMDSDDGTMWAPEVLDCRFSYFDGYNWLDSWDSIQKEGLPIAIKTELKLAPLDDVDLYRSSPLLYSLPVAPDVETLSKLTAQLQDQGDSGVNTSRLAGSLTGVDGGTPGKSVDVFNSYRPIPAIRAAIQGIRLDNSTASAYSEIAYSAALTQSFADEAAAANSLDGVEQTSDAVMGGGLGSASSAANAGLGGSKDVGGSLTPDDGTDPALKAVQEMVANGAVFNEAGVCVDYSNDGSYITLEQMAAEIGVAEPIVYELITYLPTTPLSRSTSLERRKPTVVRSGNVSLRQDANPNASRERRQQGENPYATGRARQYQERSQTERAVADRAPRERNRADRQASDRGAANRQVAERGGAEQRGLADRGIGERAGAPERGPGTRQFQERRGANGGWTEPELTEAPGDIPGVVDGSLPGSLPVDPIVPEPLPPPVLPEPTGGLAGGLAGTGGATRLDGLDPFAIVDQQAGSVPFASATSEFDQIGGMTAPGLIEQPTGADTVASPTAPTRPAQRQQQTWIRGKR